MLNAQAFCDEAGAPLTQEQAGRRLDKELELDRRMRMFFRHRFSQTCAQPRAPPALNRHVYLAALPGGPLSGVRATTDSPAAWYLLPGCALLKRAGKPYSHVMHNV